MRRANFKYLMFGGFTGWMLGYIFALSANSWYFATGTQIFTSAGVGAFFGSLMYNALMMNEEFSHKVKYAITGGMIGYIFASLVTAGILKSPDFMKISFQNALIFDWALIHCAIIIGIIGFLIGSRADRRLLQT